MREDICNALYLDLTVYAEFPNGIPIESAGSVFQAELLSSLVFEACRSCGDLVGFCGFNSVFERDACDDFGKVIKAA